jgi:hypothetical protein
VSGRHLDRLLADALPRVKTYATLSPVPGFRHWLADLPAEQLDGLAQAEARQVGTEDFHGIQHRDRAGLAGDGREDQRHQVAQLTRAEVAQLITRIASKPRASRLRRLKGCKGCGHLCGGLGTDDPLGRVKTRAASQRASVKEDARTSHAAP